MLLRKTEQVAHFLIMEYYELPTLILFENKNDQDILMKERVFDQNWDKTVHQKENYASKPRPFTLFCRVIY